MAMFLKASLKLLVLDVSWLWMLCINAHKMRTRFHLEEKKSQTP